MTELNTTNQSFTEPGCKGCKHAWQVNLALNDGTADYLCGHVMAPYDLPIVVDEHIKYGTAPEWCPRREE